MKCKVFFVIGLFVLHLSACTTKQVENISSIESTQEDVLVATEIVSPLNNIEEVSGEIYSYDVEKRMFSFWVDETVYNIPYAQIGGCADSALEWKINHTLWEEACWIFDCAKPGDGLYGLFEGDSAISITGIYPCGQYLSVVYELGYIGELPGNIVYAIVVDTFTGERVLLKDMIKEQEIFGEKLEHYFDADEREIRLFLSEEKVEEILHYSGMTESEIVNSNVSFDGTEPDNITGEVGSISFLFDATSFYMTENSFVVLPGADYYEPLVFTWEAVKDAVWLEKIACELPTVPEQASLDVWVRRYIFEEAYAEPEQAPLVMNYSIEIYKENEEYLANVEIVGQTTMVAAKAKVCGDAEQIDLIFQEYNDENVTELSCESGEKLLSLRQWLGKLYTYWGVIEPMLEENEQTGGVCFVEEPLMIYEEDILNGNICEPVCSVYDNELLSTYLRSELEQAEYIYEQFGGSKLIAEYSLFDFNDDGIEDFFVSFAGATHSGSHGNSARILIRNKYDSLERVFSATVHLCEGNGEYIPVAVLKNKTNGFYDLLLQGDDGGIWSMGNDGHYDFYKTGRIVDGEN